MRVIFPGFLISCDRRVGLEIETNPIPFQLRQSNTAWCKFNRRCESAGGIVQQSKELAEDGNVLISSTVHWGGQHINPRTNQALREIRLSVDSGHSRPFASAAHWATKHGMIAARNSELHFAFHSRGNPGVSSASKLTDSVAIRPDRDG